MYSPRGSIHFFLIYKGVPCTQKDYIDQHKHVLNNCITLSNVYNLFIQNGPLNVLDKISSVI